MRRSWPVILALTATGWAAPPVLPAEYPVHAFTHARIYVTPERILNNATLVIERGRISQVAENLSPPPGARIWDCTGKVIHAGFVEPFLGDKEAQNEASADKPSANRSDHIDHRAAGTAAKTEAGEAAAPGQAERQVENGFSLSKERLDKLRGLGILTLQLVPQQGAWRGQGALFTLKTDNMADNLLRGQSCQVIGLRTLEDGAQEEDYPASLMGNLAFLRETLRRATWAEKAQPAGAPPGWAALRKARQENLPFYFEGRSLMEGVALQRTLKPLQLPLIWVTTPDAVLRPAWLQGKIIATVDFPKLPTHPARRSEVSFARAAEWRSAPQLGARLPRGSFCYSLHRLNDWSKYPQRLLSVLNGGLSEAELLDSLTRRPARWLGLNDLGTLERGNWATLVVRRHEPFALDGVIEQVWVQGVPRRVGEDHQHELTPVVPGDTPEYSPPAPWAGAGSVLVRGATVWTQSAQGRVVADVLAKEGKIVAIGPNLTGGPGVSEVDGTGKHLVPGLIDAHSHTALTGDVNEATLNVTPQANTLDIINPLDPQILHQLAGGVTCAHLLHGSANAIGGRTVTVKWRWGGAPDQLVMQQAPPGIKFALGENPKESNWGDAYTRRYPQTRQGVAALIRQRFQEALKYRQEQQAGLSPQPDEGLETLLEILDGRRLVHAHSYRQDEILMLLQLAEELKFKIATLQHGLEAYKVADSIARHGAGVSTFSDWWAYKLEVMDAIPYNGPLLHERGVVTSFNSDSDELARRILGEAAKAVRYGGLSEVEALNFLTLHPARQLRIEKWVGSLEVGKDADFALWSGSPFEPDSYCLETWVEGRSLFQRQRYHAEQQQRRALRDQWLRAAGAEVTE